jgi:hypothetical protein
MESAQSHFAQFRNVPPIPTGNIVFKTPTPMDFRHTVCLMVQFSRECAVMVHVRISREARRTTPNARGDQRMPARRRKSKTLPPIHVRKGAFHKWLGKKPGSPITAADIAKGKASGDPHVVKMANFAASSKKWR